MDTSRTTFRLEPHPAKAYSLHMDELIFDVTIDEDGRFLAQARGNGIATDGASWVELRAEVKDLIACYYGDSAKPARVQLLLADELAVA